MKVNYEKGSKERLLEMMGKVNPEFQNHADNQIVKTITGQDNINEEQPDVDSGDEQQISQEDLQAVKNLEKKAETAIPSEQDNEKSVIASKDQNTTIKVQVPTYKKGLADKSIASLKKLAKKLGLPEPTVTTGNPYKQKFTKTYDSDEPGGHPQYKTFVIDVFDLTVDTSRLYRLGGGYDLVAVVDNTTGGSIETNPEHRVPTEYLNPSEQCDLCNQERYRGKCFVVTDKNHDYKRLGSSCVKKYIGIDPSKFIKVLDFMRDFQDSMKELGDGDDFLTGGGGSGMWSSGNLLTDFSKAVSITYDLIEKEGYVKKEYDQHDWRHRTNLGQSTYEKVEYILGDDQQVSKYPVNNQVVKEFTDYVNSLEIDYKKSEGFVDFLINLKKLPETNVRIKDVGVIAAGLNMFKKHKERIAKDAEVKDSQWLGEVGSKIKVSNAKLVDVRSGDGQFGTWYLWSFIDQNGNSLKKFGTLSEKFRIQAAPENSEDLFGFKKGDIFAFTAEVKNHDTYNGVKSTMLGRLSKA